jgi:hypothetical protein
MLQGTLHENQYMFLTTSCFVLLIIRMFQTKIVGIIKTHFRLNNRVVYKIVWKNMIEAGK